MSGYAQMLVQLWRDPKHFHRLKAPGSLETLCGQRLKEAWRWSNGRQRPCETCVMVLTKIAGQEEVAA